jgi:hypothetical protein
MAVKRGIVATKKTSFLLSFCSDSIHYNNKIYGLYNDTDVLTRIQLRKLEWAAHICRMYISRAPRKILERKIHGSQLIGKPKDM